MAWTIEDITRIPIASFPIEQPVSGTVKFAGDVKENEIGKSQWFILKDATGEIGVAYYPGGKDATEFSPVAVGDQVEICAVMGGKGKLSGAAKGQYEKEGKTIPKLTVYGNRLKNLSTPVSTQTAAFSPSQAQIGAPAALQRQGQAILTEEQAVATYWRLFEVHAGHLSSKVSAAAVTFEGFLVEASEELLLLCHRASETILEGILSGTVSPAAAAKPPRSAATTNQRPDPEWMDGLPEDYS